MSTNMLPDEYEVPQKAGNYMKFQDGENQFRFLSQAIVGWEGWIEDDGNRKPIRHKMDEPFDPSEIDPETIKHFWAVVVWNYSLKRVQILEITQRGIQKSLRALEKSKAWGSLLNYDILVTKSGQKLETEYQVNPCPPKLLDKEISKEYKATDIDLEKLFTGEDPFGKKTEVNPDDIPDNL